MNKTNWDILAQTYKIFKNDHPLKERLMMKVNKLDSKSFEKLVFDLSACTSEFDDIWGWYTTYDKPYNRVDNIIKRIKTKKKRSYYKYTNEYDDIGDKYTYDKPYNIVDSTKKTEFYHKDIMIGLSGIGLGLLIAGLLFVNMH